MADQIMSLEEFFAEARRLKLTAADLVPKLVVRPEFADCLSDDFKQAKNTIMSLPEQDVRALAIAQFIQLRTHEKYGNTMQNLNAALRAEQVGNGGVNACPAPRSEVPPGKWKVDLPDGLYAQMPGDPPGPADLRRIVGGYVYELMPRTGALRAASEPRMLPGCVTEAVRADGATEVPRG